MTKDYSRRGSASSLFGGVDCLVRSSTSINTTNSWPFDSNPSSSKNNNKSSHPNSNGSSDISMVTSLSTLSSMLDDEELWAEFKNELEASNIKTGLGIQGMLSKFLAAKGMEEQQKKDREDAKEKEQMMDVENYNELLLLDVPSTASVGSRRRNHRDRRKSDFGVLHSRGSTTISGAAASKTGKMVRRFSSNISASFAAEVEKEADDTESLWAMHKRRRDSGIVGGGNDDNTVLPGRRVSVDHDDIHPYPGGLRVGDRGDSAHWMPNPNNSDNHEGSSGNTHQGVSNTEDNYHISPRDKGSSIKEERKRSVLGRSCPQDIFVTPALKDGESSSSLQRGSGITNGLDQRLSKSYTSSAMINKEEDTNVSSSSSDSAPNVKKMFKDWFVALSKERRGSANSDCIIDGSVNGDQNESKSTSDRNCNSDVMNSRLTPHWTAAHSEGESVQQDDGASSQPSFQDWFGSLGGETNRRGSVKDSIDGSVNDRNKRKLSIRRNDRYNITSRDYGSCLNNTAIDSNRRNRGEQNDGSQDVNTKSSSLKASKSCDMNQDDDVTMHDMTDIRNIAVSLAQQQASHSMRSCLKREDSSKNCGTPSSSRSSLTLTSLDDGDDDEGQGTANLLRLLLSLDCGPSKERAKKKKATTSSSQFSRSNPPHIAEEKNEKENEKKKEVVAKKKMTMQQGSPAMSLSQSSSTDPPCIAEGNEKKNPNDQDRAEEIEKKMEGAAAMMKMMIQQRAPPLDPTSRSISADFLLTMNTSQLLSSNYPEESKKKKDGVAAMTMMQQGTPHLDLTSRSISADFLISKNKSHPSFATLKYQPQRKHANKKLRQRQVRALQDDVVNRSTTTELTNSSSGSTSTGSDEALKQHMQSIMSTGSIMDIRKPIIPVVDSDSKHLDWSSNNGNTAAFTLQRQLGVSTILPSKSNGNNPSSMIQNSPLQMMSSSNSVISIKDSKELRQMQVQTLQDNIVNRSMTIEVTNFSGSSDDSDNTLSRNMKGIISTGSMMDIQKRHIPVSKNQDWSSVDWSSQKELLKNEAAAVPTSLQRHPQAMIPSSMLNTKNQNAVSMRPSKMMSSIFPNKKDGNHTSPSKTQSNPPPTMISSADSILSMMSMMSTGSTKDMRRRHIPTMTMSAMIQNRERGSTNGGIPTVDWGATASHGNHVHVLDRPQTTGNAYLNRQTVVDVLSTTDSTKDMISKLDSIPKTAVATMERQHQGRQSGTVQGAPSSRQQQQPVYQFHQAALRRICDLKTRHSKRQLQMASGDVGNNSPIDDNGPMKTTPGNCGIDFRRHQTTISNSTHEREHAAKELKMAQVHPLPVVKPKNKDQMPSLSFSNRRRVAATTTKQESITMLEYMQKKHEFENKRTQVRSRGGPRGDSAGSSSAQKEITEAKSNSSAGASNAGCTDLFRRYLENKASNGAPCEISSANSKDDTSPPRACPYNSVAHTLTAPRGSAANTSKAMAVGQLLVDWGDTCTTPEEEDEYNRVLSGVLKNEYHQEPCIPKGKEKKKERQKETVVLTVSNQIVEDRCITVNPNEAALRRVSDITTYSFDENEDDLAMMSGYPQEEEEEHTTPSLASRNEEPTAPALAFKKKMRTLSIAEEPTEEEDFDDW